MRVHPDYDFSDSSILITGITNLYTPSVVYGMLHTTLPVTPIYIAIFITRWKIIKVLKKNQSSMSKGTRAQHDQLLKILTIQAILPSTSFFTSWLFMGCEFKNLEGMCEDEFQFQ